jgi:rhodanese-related sulfurtransferase
MVSQTNPKDAFAILQNDDKAVLIDVRTKPELDFVGCVDTAKFAAKSVFLQWKIYPDMAMNHNFVDELDNIVKSTFSDDNPEEIKLLFLCRSGARSLEASMFMSDLGYDCHNIVGGFEGDVDENGQRGNKSGWKAANLPWRQH